VSSFGPSVDIESAGVEDRKMRPIDDRRFKGLPLPVGMPLTRIGDLGWNALRDLEYPALVLHEERLVHNITMMADYCHDHRVELAPHAKTSLSPQLIRRQMEAGAWGATAATAAQVRGLLAVGVPRILLANLLVDPVAIRWIVTHVLRQGNTGFSCYVDSMASVELLDRECGQADPAGPLDVLLEVGYLGGRTGVRSLEESLAVARAVNQSKHLCLVGVAGYEGLMPGAAAGEPAGLEAYLESIAQTARGLSAAGLFAADRAPLVSAGGSSYFDRVVARLGPHRFGFPVQTILRSGCYLTHDHGIYRRTSPFDGRRIPTGPRLQPAFELLASVLSRPEPTLVIVASVVVTPPSMINFRSSSEGTVTTVDEATRRVCGSQSSTISMRFCKYLMNFSSAWVRCGRSESAIPAARSTGGLRYR
jgi:D-serine dehydratase